MSEKIDNRRGGEVTDKEKIMSQTPFNFIIHLRAKSGSEQALKDALMACVAPTRAEAGNVNYDLHQNQDDPAIFVIYVGWKGRDALEAHSKTAHFKTLMAATEELVAERGPDNKPFTNEALVMISDIAARRSCQTVFVLIHGSWHGAWCYEKVAAFLNLQGYPVVACDLPGHGLLAKFPTSYFNRPLPLPGDFNTEPSPVASVSLENKYQLEFYDQPPPFKINTRE